VRTYPETIQGARTTPRTLTQFFDQIADLPDLKADLELEELFLDPSSLISLAPLRGHPTLRSVRWSRWRSGYVEVPDDLRSIAMAN
jgi:hypothetical protein